MYIYYHFTGVSEAQRKLAKQTDDGVISTKIVEDEHFARFG